MSRQTIVTVESYDDSTTRQMLKNLYENDKLRQFEIHHCFIAGAQNADELYDILSQAVREHKASILLIHTGSEFYRLMGVFPDTLQKLTSHFAGLKIGIQNREKQRKKFLKYISNEQYVKDLEEKFFYINR